jgi:hypothetical protein
MCKTDLAARTRLPHHCPHSGLKRSDPVHRTLIPHCGGTKAQSMIQARALLLLVLWSAGCAASPLTIDDPLELQKIEGNGFTFGEIVVGPQFASGDSAQLYRHDAYRTIVDSLAQDLERLKSTDSQLGVTIKARHRLFDINWLKSSSSRFELVGVVNRMDRAIFAPGTCGEIRFLYRLAYRKDEPSGITYSRLPMTANVVFLLPGEADACRVSARQWIDGTDLNVFWRGVLSRRHLKSVEFNVQAVRWPSTLRPDMGGYAEYFLRVFKPTGDTYALATLENTPDVAKLSTDVLLKQRLLEWLKAPEHFRAVDEGIALLPDEFLARKATSVALHGSHRLANMPFTEIFSEADLADLPYPAARTARSPHGLLRRLNDLSCTGCHQGRTIAGFHFLGIDRPQTDAANAIAVAASPHFVLDQPRRRAYVEAVANGEAAIAARPLSVRAARGEGGFGSHCGLGDPSFSTWSCDPKLRCEAVTADDTVSRTGVCLPAPPTAGSVCQPARIVHDRDPHRDRLIAQRDTSCGVFGVCESSQVGFPGGMCSGSCAGGMQPGETCGSIAILQTFNGCLAARRPFAQCLRDNVRPARLKACGRDEPCRDDFICAGTSTGQGACIPPYLFQLRVDGHPSP